MATDGPEIAHDPHRIAALDAADLRATGSEDAFQRLARVARSHLGVPMALVTMVDRERQLFKGSYGLPEPWASRGETPLTYSLCRHVVADGEPLVVRDAREDERARASLAVEELDVRAYAGVPVRAPDGTVLGTVAALSDVPREWSAEDVGFLHGLAAAANLEVERRTSDTEGRASVDYRELVDGLPIGVIVHTAGEIRLANREAASIAGVEDPELLVGSRIDDFVHPEERARVRSELRKVQEEGEAIPLAHYRTRLPDGSEGHVEAAAIPVRVDGETAVQVMVRDVTERFRARRALETSEERQRLLLEQMPAVLWTTDRDLTFTSSAGAGLEGLGLEPGEVVGASVRDFAEEEAEGEEERDAALRMHERALAGRAGDYTISFAGRHFQARVEPLVSGEGAIMGVVGCALDVTDRVEAEEERRRTEERYRTLLALAPVAMFLDRQGRILYANRAGAKLLGADEPEALVGREVFDFVAEESLPDVRERIRRVERDGVASEVRELVLERIDGERRIGEIRSIPVDVGDATASLSIIRDVTEERRARRALQESERRFRSLFEDSRDAIFLTRADGEIEQVNEAFLELFGYRPRELDELRARDLYADPEERERFRSAVEQSGSVKDYEVRAVKRDGTTFPCLITATTRVDGEGEVVGYQGIARDVTEQRRFERQLEHQALHDELTDLPNRSLFWDRLEHALARAQRGEGNRKLAVLFVDLDRFKLVNDSLGHAAGDQVLVQTARRLESRFRAEDTIARFGGDEFTVLLEEVGDDAGVEEAARRFLEVLEEPMQVEGETVHLGASVGVTVTDAESIAGEGVEPDDLVRRADSAMFRAKAEPGSSIRFYDPSEDEEERGRLQHERELREGLERGEFTVHFQPIVDLATGRIVGGEPLARWEHPDRGTVQPDEFIGLAEDSGLIVPLGEALLEEACRATVRWLGEGAPEDFTLHPNLSARQFEARDLVGSVEDVLSETGLDPGRVCFEVTERIAMRGSERLDALRALGVGIAVDDFGIGYSSLNYLKRLEVDALKIDATFVSGLGEDPRDEAIVRTILTLGETMGLAVVAEGIERERQLELLREFGCARGQGFLFARPVPRDRFGELLAERRLG